jgi:hypothetical protein
VAERVLQDAVPSYVVAGPLPVNTGSEDLVPWAHNVAAEGMKDEDMPELVLRNTDSGEKKPTSTNTIKTLSGADPEAVLKVIRDQQSRSGRNGHLR